MKTSRSLWWLAFASTSFLSAAVRPQERSEPLALEEGFFSEVHWRSIGPAGMGGRIVDFAVDPVRQATFFVATASGGLFKTDNNGTTWTPVFDRQTSVSLGDVAIAPSDPKVVWVGTGESNVRNSVAWGDGVYKSLDGGKTWAHMGLEKSFQIGRIVIHPTDPNTVFVAALGRLWGENAERGLYKTTDGGKTWTHVLRVDARTGCGEVAIDPSDPRFVYAAAYERTRDIHDGNDPDKRWGPGAGMFRSTDGGETFQKMGKGLPTCQIGRVGFDIYRKDPRVLFAIVETERIGQSGRPAGAEAASQPAARPGYLGVQGSDHPQGIEVTTVTDGSPAANSGLRVGDVIKELNKSPLVSVEAFTAELADMLAGDAVELKWSRGEQSLSAKITLAARPAGQGRGARGGGDQAGQVGARLGGQNANMMERQGPDGFETGGVYRSDDRGETWRRINSLNPRPYYFSQIRVDPSDDRYLYAAGVQLHASSDGGKTFRTDGAPRVHADHHAIWIDPKDGEHMLLGCDGGVHTTYDRGKTWEMLDNLVIGQFYNVAVDMRRPYNVYGGLQDNGSWGGPSASRFSDGIRNQDWTRVGGGDGFACQVDPTDSDTVYVESQYGAISRINVATGARATIRPPGTGQGGGGPGLGGQGGGNAGGQGNEARPGARNRFNWNTPFFLSHHNPRVLYWAGNRVYKSLNRGDSSIAISEDITRTDKGTASAIAESPVNADVLYAGSDDGNLWVTRDGGRGWKSIVGSLPELPGPRYVSRIEPSHFREGRVYVTLDGHRSDDLKPYVFVSENFGAAFTRLDSGLPEGSVHVIREDLVKEDLLFLGTEFSVFASLDRGKSWLHINQNLPTVAVRDLVIHPRDAEMVAATHGRSIWIIDVQPFRELVGRLDRRFHLLPVKDVTRLTRRTGRESMGHKDFVAPNPSTNATIYYYLADEPAGEMRLTVEDALGKVVRDLRAPGRAGLHAIQWDLRLASGRDGFRGPGGRADQGQQGGGQQTEGQQGGGQQGRGGGRGGTVPDGDYVVRIKVAGEEAATLVRVRNESPQPGT